MYTNDAADTTAPRRRIIQQPLRTEAPVALIASDLGALGELPARLKRAHPLITFPTLSHFLAEPPQRWAAVVVARSGAWDAQLDQHVRRRRCIALFGQNDEGYGWPEEVARLREVADVDGWLEALKAPDPILEKVRKKRERPRPAPSPSPSPSSSPSKARSVAPASAQVMLPLAELAALSAASTPEPETERAGPAETATRESRRRRSMAPSVARRTSQPPAGGTRRKRANASGTLPLALPAPRPSKHGLGLSDAQVDQLIALVSELPPSARVSAAEHAFLRAAAELGLLRADELVEELRAQAPSLALALSDD